jgi:CubicO group peptidase (beta-lactamase class C family)
LRLWRTVPLPRQRYIDGSRQAVDRPDADDHGQGPAGRVDGVWDAKKGYHIGAYGEAVLPDTVATVGDHSRIGSVSKTFTTATILRLVDQGKLTHWGDGWVGHTGQIIGWESFAAYNVKTGDAIVLMVNETGFLPDALLALLGVANPELRLKLAAAR